MSLSPVAPDEVDARRTFSPLNQQPSKVMPFSYKRARGEELAERVGATFVWMDSKQYVTYSGEETVLFGCRHGCFQVERLSGNTLIYFHTSARRSVFSAQYGETRIKPVYPTLGQRILIESTPPQITFFWGALKSAHGPYISPADRDIAFIRAFDANTDVWVQPAPDDQPEVTVGKQQLGFVCVQCLERFDSLEAWQHHFTDVPYAFSTAPFKKVVYSIPDRQTRKRRRLLKLDEDDYDVDESSPRPMKQHNSQSLSDPGYPKYMLEAAVRKLEKFAEAQQRADGGFVSR